MNKICSRCNEEKCLDLFPRTPSGYRSYCKTCKNKQELLYSDSRDARYKRWITSHPEARKEHAARYSKKVNLLGISWRHKNKDKANALYAKRRASKRNASVPWANDFFMEETYSLAKLREKYTGIEWHVDHIIPLINPNVCGLHMENNLQVIPARQNLQKGNKFIETDK